MELIIDCREQKLYDLCLSLVNTVEKFKNIKLSSANLEIGDIIVNFNGDNKLIIERKTVSDLLASIKDKRYDEQHHRLNASVWHPHNIFYLIEGSTVSLTHDKQTVYSSIFSMSYYKGFSILKSESLNDSAYILCNMALKISIEENKGTSSFYQNKHTIIDEENKAIEENLDSPKQENYCTFIKKNKNITVDNIGEIFLCQIPSISSVTAIAVMKEFKSFGNLVEALKSEHGIEKLRSIKCGKTERKISKTSVQNIVDFLK
jgi:ERCC4-type nuclease